jgi:hypothetical protein
MRNDTDADGRGRVVMAERLCTDGNEQACKLLRQMCETGQEEACRAVSPAE